MNSLQTSIANVIDCCTGEWESYCLREDTLDVVDVTVAPLPIGHNTIHFHGAAGPYVQDVTYHIYVYH